VVIKDRALALTELIRLVNAPSSLVADAGVNIAATVAAAWEATEGVDVPAAATEFGGWEGLEPSDIATSRDADSPLALAGAELAAGAEPSGAELCMGSLDDRCRTS
jgi:hypothetical protein